MHSPGIRLASRLGLQLLLICVIAACTPTASLAPSAPSARPPTQAPSATGAPTLTLTPPSPAPSLTPVGELRTPSAGPATATVSGITWSKVERENELARVISITSWSGGLVARGELVVSGGTARTPLWTSADGATWQPVTADVFGHDAAVLGIAATPGGLVALTVRASAAPCEGEPELSCPALHGPITSWTSTDATSWTAHAAPGLDALSPIVSIEQIDLRAGPTGLLAFAREYHDLGLAVSTDGSTWEPVPASSLPTGFEIWNVDAFDSEWIATGITWNGPDEEPFGQPTVVTSTDGRTWQERAVPITGFPTRYGVDQIGSDIQHIYAAREGVIVTGGVQGAPSADTWWSSLDGHAWRAEPDYRPLGVWNGEGGNSTMSADGVIVANGSLMIAFRVQDDAAAWSSTDGRHWTSLAMHASPYEGLESAGGRLLFTPIGIVWEQDSGTAWLGELAWK